MCIVCVVVQIINHERSEKKEIVMALMLCTCRYVAIRSSGHIEGVCKVIQGIESCLFVLPMCKIRASGFLKGKKGGKEV